MSEVKNDKENQSFETIDALADQKYIVDLKQASEARDKVALITGITVR